MPPAELNRIFFLQLQVIGSTMGTRAELANLLSLLVCTGLRPPIDRTLPLTDVADGLAAMESSSLVGKIVIEP
jgi:D-arabinose 1-dehydrogenase-like Zn-dependent alcohol dehydrogenase